MAPPKKMAPQASLNNKEAKIIDSEMTDFSEGCIAYIQIFRASGSLAVDANDE